MARFLRSYGVSILRKPAVFEPALLGSDYRLKVKVVLAGRTRSEAIRRSTHSWIGEPTSVFVEAPAEAARPIQTHLAGRTRSEMIGRRAPASRLRPPVVVSEVQPLVVQAGPIRQFVTIKPPPVRSELRPPTVVTQPAAFIADPIRVHLAGRTRAEQSRRERHMGWTYPQTDTARRLSTGPSVEQLVDVDVLDTAGYYVAQSFIALGTNLAGVSLAVDREQQPLDSLGVELRTDSGGLPSGTILSSTTVLGITIEDLGANYINIPGINSSLIPGTRYWIVFYRTGSTDFTNYYHVFAEDGGQVYGSGSAAFSVDSGANWAAYNPPGFDLGAIFWQTVGTHPLRQPFIGVRPPLVIEERPFAPPIKVDLAAISTATSMVRRAPHSRLRPPTVVTPAFVADPIRVHLTRIKPPPIKSRLEPPTALQVFDGPRTHLTRIKPPPIKSRLEPPQVVRVPSVEQEQQTIDTPFARIFPPPIHSKLRPPTVLQVFSGPKVYLTRIKPPPVGSYVAAPAVLDTKPPVESLIVTKEIRIRPPAIKSVLRPPAVVGAFVAEVYYAGKPHLVRIRPPAVRSELRPPPSILQTFDAGKPHLTRIRPPAIKSRLESPTVVRVPSVEQEQQTISVHLARIRPAQTRSKLRPPRVVTPAAEPTRDQSTITVVLARIRPPRMAADLRAPRVVIPVPTQDMQTISRALVRIRPAQTRSRLRPPTRLEVFFTGKVELVRIRPPQTRSKLRRPATLEPFSHQLQQRTISVTLARIRPPKTRSRLPVFTVRAPAVVTLRKTQVRIRPPQTRSKLRQPTVIDTRIYFGPVTALVRIRPPSVHSRIRPPSTLIAAFIARPIKVVLTRIIPPPVHHLLRVIIGEFRAPHGHVCGSDGSPCRVCGAITTPTTDTGTDSTVNRVSGSSSSRSRISGQTTKRTRTVGRDEEAS